MIRFYPSKVRSVIESVFNEKLAKENYDPKTSPEVAEDLLNLLRFKLKTGTSSFVLLCAP